MCAWCEVWAQAMNLIDLLAIVPFYIELGLGNGSQLQFLRVMRLTRVVRWRRPSRSRIPGRLHPGSFPLTTLGVCLLPTRRT